MNAMKRFGAFWYQFIVGDDWRITASVVFGLGLTALLVHIAHLQAWWLLPVMVIAMLTLSLWLETRRK